MPHGEHIDSDLVNSLWRGDACTQLPKTPPPGPYDQAGSTLPSMSMCAVLSHECQ